MNYEAIPTFSTGTSEVFICTSEVSYTDSVLDPIKYIYTLTDIMPTSYHIGLQFEVVINFISGLYNLPGMM